MLTQPPQLGKGPFMGSFQDVIYRNYYFSFTYFFVAFKGGFIYKSGKVKNLEVKKMKQIINSGIKNSNEVVLVN